MWNVVLNHENRYEFTYRNNAVQVRRQRGRRYGQWSVLALVVPLGMRMSAGHRNDALTVWIYDVLVRALFV
jgi:hypothetical protein